MQKEIARLIYVNTFGPRINEFLPNRRGRRRKDGNLSRARARREGWSERGVPTRNGGERGYGVKAYGVVARNVGDGEEWSCGTSGTGALGE